VANQPTTILNRWQTQGDTRFFQKLSSKYPSDIATAYGNALQSDLTFSDASYLRLKNLSLSWQFPEKWGQRMHLQNARIYIHGQNLITVTKYIGLDPETKSILNLPPLRTWTFGALVNL
jgi:hypothetical protein